MGLDICFEKEFVLDKNGGWEPTEFYGTLPHFRCSYSVFNIFRGYLQDLATKYEGENGVDYFHLLTVYYRPGLGGDHADELINEFIEHQKDYPGLYAIWRHSDCDGGLTGEEQKNLAVDLRKIQAAEDFTERSDEEVNAMGENERDNYERLWWLHKLMQDLLQMCDYGEPLVFS